MNKNNPIGVFDSGIGGLTVLDELINHFPHEDFIYVADTLHCPYGIKPKEEIASLVTRVTSYLLDQNCKAIVIACNTATANSAHLQDITSIPIIGVIEPTAKEAIAATVNKKIGILATNATIESNIYQDLIINNNLEAYPVKCSEFVEPIEAGEIDTDYSHQLVASHLHELRKQNVDTIILGCTHFSLYKREIKKVFPNSQLIDSGVATSKALYQELKNLDLLKADGVGKVYLKNTKDEKLMRSQIGWFKKPYMSIEKIEI